MYYPNSSFEIKSDLIKDSGEENKGIVTLKAKYEKT